jgi:hypothetical protein
MFGLNMRLLLGLIVFLILLFLVVVGSWTGIRIWVFRRRQKREQHDALIRSHRPDGTPLPPMGEGVCERCQTVSEALYHLPSGRRLCRDCYESTEAH